jgi:hypothetical protein
MIIIFLAAEHCLSTLYDEFGSYTYIQNPTLQVCAIVL